MGSRSKVVICILILLWCYSLTNAQQTYRAVDLLDEARKHFELGEGFIAFEGHEGEAIPEYLLAINRQLPTLPRAVAALNEIGHCRNGSAAPYLAVSNTQGDYGRYDKAWEYTEAALKKYPDSVEANLELCRIHRPSPERLAR